MKEKQKIEVPRPNKDISKPFMDTEIHSKLVESGQLPVVFVKPTIGYGFLKKTKKMKKAKLDAKGSYTGSRWFASQYPERVIRDIIIDYCNRSIDPETLLERIKQDVAKNIKIKRKKVKQ